MKQCVGFIMNTARGWMAYDAAEKSIGRFTDEQGAALAVYQQADTARPRDGG
jgi:hypothetical protein